MAKAKFMQKGESISYKAENPIGYMDVVPFGARIGIALEEIPAGGTGTIALRGVYEIPAAKGTAITAGDKVYFNASDGTIVKTASGNISAGVAVEDKASEGTLARVLID